MILHPMYVVTSILFNTSPHPYIHHTPPIRSTTLHQSDPPHSTNQIHHTQPIRSTTLNQSDPPHSTNQIHHTQPIRSTTLNQSDPPHSTIPHSLSSCAKTAKSASVSTVPTRYVRVDRARSTSNSPLQVRQGDNQVTAR